MSPLDLKGIITNYHFEKEEKNSAVTNVLITPELVVNYRGHPPQHKERLYASLT